MHKQEPRMYKRSEMLQVGQVARMWGCSRQHIINLIEEGKLKAFRFGFSRSWFVSKDSVEQLSSGTEI